MSDKPGRFKGGERIGTPLHWPYGWNASFPGWFLCRMDDFWFWGIISKPIFRPLDGLEIKKYWRPRSAKSHVSFFDGKRWPHHFGRKRWRRGYMFETFSHCGTHFLTDAFREEVEWEKRRCKVGPYKP